MLKITAYKCSDGAIFENEKRAKTHQDDLTGAEIEKLLKLFQLELTRSQEFKGVLAAMKNQDEFLKQLKAVLFTLEHDAEEKEDCTQF